MLPEDLARRDESNISNPPGRQGLVEMHKSKQGLKCHAVIEAHTDGV